METNAVITLQAGEVGIFGYGSLLCRESMELTLGRAYTGQRVVCSLAGWRRSWDVFMPNTIFYEPSGGEEFVPRNIVYLNVRRNEGEAVNGLVYVLSEAELDAFDRREWIYDRTPVTAAVVGAEVRGGEVFTYVAKKDWVLEAGQPRSWAAIRRTYVEIVAKGLGELGPEFAGTYGASTDPLPAELLFQDQKRAGSHPLLAETKPQV